jgi:transcription initiation factor IIE alpha subunit
VNNLIIVIDIDAKDAKRKDIYYFLHLVFFEDMDYDTYENMTHFQENLNHHIDKDVDNNYVCIINCKTKEFKVSDIQTKVRIVDVEND